MARTNTTTTSKRKDPEIKDLKPVIQVEEPLYTWERIAGKHHLRTPAGVKVIKVGDTIVAPKDAYVHDRSWKLVGPVTPSVELPVSKFVLRKESAGEEGGFNIFKEGEDKPLNNKPLTEAEADELVNASLESN